MKQKTMKIKTFGFDPSAVRDMGKLFLPETSKTLTNGSSPGFHAAIVMTKNGYWTNNDGTTQEYVYHYETNDTNRKKILPLGRG